ncbi:fumarylacetoacetate hydrolase family protein [Subtercola boreus]|uniref:2-hydroxyhepta-2,4-diene-1,7-dioate isomerase n=1 Tax=Subtercola boreus TaxID=120213 RepID=A0A3E0WD24_9MICO|nr:fumarylacetoacetate hydrolase family protein [Subtercola boreus]RFA22710.1 2-hydroxyhepta-2,4-diene-1,7-dioate isomerase [Subtercola boreus]RFA23065.1 2-hydroxyhepta-2,4-diene-1,7-dioate isomerase [Subtercola boreus]RFA28818.1 2-hydroxyhepta-2,4-diene-1,7-dioate isomerase [Subtercola boreus]
MRIARFSTGADPQYGIIDGDDLVVLQGDPMFQGFITTEERVPLASAKLLAPVIPRSKVVAVGKNYADHAAEMGGVVPERPLLFLKPNTSVVGPGDTIVLPPDSQRVEHEAELAIVIGSLAKNVRAEDYAEVVFGYTIANDVTARDLQALDGQWARAKGFDTFCPLGPFIETEFDVSDALIEARVDGVLKQHGNLSDMIFGVPEIVAYASRAFTLLPGDVILTGTPAGVGPFTSGQTVEVSIAGLGTLTNVAR